MGSVLGVGGAADEYMFGVRYRYRQTCTSARGAPGIRFGQLVIGDTRLDKGAGIVSGWTLGRSPVCWGECSPGGAPVGVG